MGMRNGPFARAIAMFSAMAALVKSHVNDSVGLRQAFDDLGAYRSRGKGRAGHQASRRCVAHDKRDACKARNRIRNRRAHA